MKRRHDGTPRRDAAERVRDIERIVSEMRAGVREALLRHKREGLPIVVWRDGRAVSRPPEQIPV